MTIYAPKHSIQKIIIIIVTILSLHGVKSECPVVFISLKKLIISFNTYISVISEYGNISPSTRNGQLFCIFYANIGIPLVSFYLVAIGKKLSIPVTKFKSRSKNKYARMTMSVVNARCFVGVLSLINRTEGWNIFEAIYYGVITLTTVGC